MIDLSLGNVNTSNKIGGLNFSKSPVSGGNGFTSVDGEQVQDITGMKEAVKLQLVNLSDGEKDALVSVLDAGDVQVSGDISGEFSCDGGYSYELVRTKKEGAVGENYFSWKMDFTLSRTVSGSGSGHL